MAPVGIAPELADQALLVPDVEGVGVAHEASWPVLPVRSSRRHPPTRLDDDLQPQGAQRLQDLADLGRLLAAFELGQKARAQVAEPRDRLQRQAPLLAMGARQAAEFLGGLDRAVSDVFLCHGCALKKDTVR